MQEDQLYVIGFTPVWGRNTFIHTYMFTETIYYTEVQTLWRAKCGGTPYFFFSFLFLDINPGRAYSHQSLLWNFVKLTFSPFKGYKNLLRAVEFAGKSGIIGLQYISQGLQQKKHDDFLQYEILREPCYKSWIECCYFGGAKRLYNRSFSSLPSSWGESFYLHLNNLSFNSIGQGNR